MVSQEPGSEAMVFWRMESEWMLPAVCEEDVVLLLAVCWRGLNAGICGAYCGWGAVALTFDAARAEVPWVLLEEAVGSCCEKDGARVWAGSRRPLSGSAGILYRLFTVKGAWGGVSGGLGS